MKNVFYAQHLSDQSNVKQQQKIKPVTLVIAELRLSEGISEAVRQLVSQQSISIVECCA